MEFSLILEAYPLLFPLATLVVGLKWIKYYNNYEKLIVLLSAFGVIIYCVSFLGKLKGNNLPSLHLWTVLEFSCISAFYFVLFQNKKLKYLIGVLSISFLLFTIINSLFIQGLDTYNSHARGLEATLLTLYSLLYIMYSIKTDEFFQKEYAPVRYYAIAMILYFGCMQFLYLTYNYLSIIANSLSNISFSIHDWLNFIFNVLLIVGLWKRKSYSNQTDNLIEVQN